MAEEPGGLAAAAGAVELGDVGGERHHDAHHAHGDEEPEVGADRDGAHDAGVEAAGEGDFEHVAADPGELGQDQGQSEEDRRADFGAQGGGFDVRGLHGFNGARPGGGFPGG